MASRDLYLINGFWGETYRRWFVDFFLPSILAPGNLAALDPDASNKLLIATSEEDWQALQTAPVFRAVGAHYEIILFPIVGYASGDGTRWAADVYSKVGKAYAPMLKRAHDDGALGLVLAPDLFLSDGLLMELRRRIDVGADIAMTAAWRSDEAKLFNALEALGYRPGGTDLQEPKALAVPARQLASILLDSIHELDSYHFWDSPSLVDALSYVFWRGPDKGLVIIGWENVMLIDYARVTRQDLDSVCKVGLGAYCARIDLEHFNVDRITDSDDGIVASWTPTAAVQQGRRKPRWWCNVPFLREIARASVFRAYVQHNFYWGNDRVNRPVVGQPILVHRSDLDSRWSEIEREARCRVASAVGDLFPPKTFGTDLDLPLNKPWHYRWMALRFGTLIFAGRSVVARNANFIAMVLLILIRAAAGHYEDRKRVLRRLARIFPRLGLIRPQRKTDRSEDVP